MRKFAIIFIVAVMIPSGALAWLALRSLHDEQLILRARQEQLFQTVADSFAKQTQNFILERQREFASIVEAALVAAPVNEVANTFDERIRRAWPLASVGFSVDLDGEVLSPNMLGRAEGRRFRVDNDMFLCSKESIEVYVSTVKGTMNLRFLDEVTASDENAKLGLKTKSRAVSPADEIMKGEASLSKLASAETDFRKVARSEREGIVGRFLQNKLHVMMWYRSPRDENTVFGAQLDLRKLGQELEILMGELEPNLRGEMCVAILDEAARVMTISDLKFSANWKRPAAASEIGEMLPHWEAAVYPLQPANFEKAASRTRLTIGMMIALMVAAIAMGSVLLLADLRRQLTLARQKSDFVSNVSHELKTPLTSIRMFSELLADGRVVNAEKEKNYLRIISTETARLTRLINNILDFARLEKGEQKYRSEPCDLAKIAREAVASYRPQFEAHGFRFEESIPTDAQMVKGDCDALAQVILNLLSNAEKYSGEKKEVAVKLLGEGKDVKLSVVDCGLGVPAGSREKIFEQFYRAHDSLSSGIQGSGLGLTLARQIARAHGGDVTYEPRPAEGSIFILRLPRLTVV